VAVWCSGNVGQWAYQQNNSTSSQVNTEMGGHFMGILFQYAISHPGNSTSCLQWDGKWVLVTGQWSSVAQSEGRYGSFHFWI